MKKSEMIQDLASAIILRLIDYKIDLSYDKAQKVADNILTRAENNGMLPPDQMTSAKFVYEWESESED